MTTLTTVSVQPTTHSKFKGNAEGLVKRLEKAGIYKKQNPQTKRGHHEKIKITDLIPLDSQRNVTDNWIYKVLKMGDGFDWTAMGLVFVARDPITKINYVWDGCGRLALASFSDIDELDCWVVEMTQAEAAKYFVRVQKTAKRSLDPNIIFCNAYANGESEALYMSMILQRLGMRIQGADDLWVPIVPREDLSNYPQVKLRAVEQAFKYAGRRGPKARDDIGDVNLIRFARDTIVQAGWNDDQIRQDLLPGLVIFYSVYPEAMKNGTNTMIRSWFQGLAQTTKQSKLTFKHSGGNQHNREAESVALGIIKELFASPKFNAGHAMVLTQKKMIAYLTYLANNQIEDEDDEE
jgi:hypothetical protein